MPTYSYSRIKCFEQCPKKYYYNYIDKPDITDETEGIEAFVGSRVHETLAKLYKDLKCEKVNSLEELIAFYDEIWEENWSDLVVIQKEGMTPKNYRALGKRCVSNYYAQRAPFDKDGITIAVERQISIEIGNEIEFIGYIDRLAAFPNGRYEIIDYKTSNTLPTQKEIEQDYQLALYELGVRQAWHDVKQVDLVWQYVAFGKELRITLTRQDREQLKRKITKIVRKIECAAENNRYPPKTSRLCDWCDFQQVCPKWSHLYKTQALPHNKYLKEKGVALVKKYAQLKAQEERFKLKHETEKEQLEKAILTRAEKEGVSRFFAGNNSVEICETETLKFPGKSDEARPRLEMILHKANLWNQVSTIDPYWLVKKFTEGNWPDKVTKQLKKFTKTEKKTTVKFTTKKKD
jgi:putative RecB family exonuclease